MLVSAEEFGFAARNIADAHSGHVGFDFETTGLSAYKGDKAFIMGFTDTEGNKYCVRDLRADLLALFFSNPRINYCPHNGKFEMSFLKRQFGVSVQNIWDTEVFARIVFNNHDRYGLQACAQRMGHSKYMPMLDWLAAQKKKKKDRLTYKDAPPELIEPYVEQDAWLSWELCRQQIEIFKHWDISSPVPIRNVVKLEFETTPHLFEMEDFGLLVDVNYCQRALEYERNEIQRAKKDFEKIAKVPFVDSRKTLEPVFKAHGISYGQTDKGNASFTEETLKGSRSHPIVESLLRHRSAQKRASSYWENFIDLEVNGIIHPSINQNRADTGRMSISDPSAQNWSTDEDAVEPAFPIRRAFVAREDCYIVSLDYSQMELRLMTDEAGDIEMKKKILEGADLHQEVADMAGVPRSLAKNGRFARQYGGGVARVAETLGVDEVLAKKICDAIDNLAVRNTAYSWELINYAKKSPFGYDYMGRRFYFDRGFEYKAPNYRIQGGCSEIIRVAIIYVGNFLHSVVGRINPLTRMIVPIHDEIVLNVHKGDEWVIERIQALMVSAYRGKHLQMEVNVTIGRNFYDLEKAV
jgi:DNA polymerase I